MKYIATIAILALPTTADALEPDKRLHLQAGALVSGAAYAVTGDAEAALWASVAAGLGKELYDAAGHGTVDAGDAIATIIGGVLTVIVMDTAKKRLRNKPSSMSYHQWRVNK
jgi:hypothetical protein